MKKTILILLLILISSISFCQTDISNDFNFGFEKIKNKERLPDNWIKRGTADYSLKADFAEKHSGSVSLLIQPMGPGTDRSFGCVAYSIPAIYEGRKIELRAFMKLQNVENGKIGLMLRIDGDYGNLQFDNMQQKNIHGTSDWKLYSVKLPLPKNAKTINIGALLTGTGKLWVDDFQLLIDSEDITKADIRQKFNAEKKIGSDSSLYNQAISSGASKTEEPVIIEKVYLHSDRDSYFPGEDIWFKAYLVDASDRFLSNFSNNLHVELISPFSEIIDSRIVRLSDGLGNGDFRLPEKLQSGQYRLRAYTNYMRNFGDQLFFNKNITIINPSDASKTFTDSTGYIKNKLEISFFPEGGSLVENVSSIVAFKAVNAIGTGCDVTGEIYSSAGELVTTFKSIHKGMGTFSLNPVPGLNYYAVVKNPYGEMVKSEIPKSFKTGVTLNLSVNNDKELVATFKTNKETLPMVLDHDLSLIVSFHNLAFKTFNIRMKSLNSFFIVPVSDLPDGIFMVTLSGPDSIPLCERLVYIQNSEEVKVKVETDKTEYKQRDSVSVRISLAENTGMPQEAFLSLSATINISANNPSQYPSTISSWFLLESDVRGPVEEPSFYFDSSNPDRLKDLDLLLLTQGWRDFKWKYGFMKYPPETGFTISGRLRKLFADVSLKNSSVNIAVFKNGKPFIKTLQADSTGRFYLDRVDLTGDAKLIVSGIGEKGRIQGWVLLDSLKYSPPKTQDNISQTGLLQSDDQPAKEYQPQGDNQLTKKNLNAFLKYAEIKTSVKAKYRLSDTIFPGEVTIIAKRQDLPESARARSERFLMALMPDREYIVTPQSEVFNNLGQLIQFKFHFGAGNIGGLAFVNPIILLDGMEVSWDDIAYMPVDWIERFDGLRPGSPAAAAWGERGKGGVISIITRTGAPESYNIPVVYHSANIKFSGYSEPRIFYSPKHHTTLEKDYKPDLRTTIFWEPNIKLENNKDLFLDYYNADNHSFVKITVEGITTSGIPVTEETEYEVK